MSQKLRFLCLLTALLLPASALCEPFVSSGSHIAWLGESDWLYLQDSEGNLKYMRTAMKDLPAMDDTTLYCLTATGSLWSVRLDGSASAILSQSPTQEQLDDLTSDAGWSLSDGVLTVTASGAQITDVLGACACGGTLYYVARTGGGSPVLQTRPLDGSQPSLLQPGIFVNAPLAMSASATHVALLAEDRSVQVVSLTDWTLKSYAAAAADTAAVLAVNETLYRYTLDASGAWHYASSEPLDGEGGAAVQSPDSAADATAVPGSAATATPAPTATPRPTATPTATPRPTATPYVTEEPAEDTTIYKGQTGSAVKQLQRRLAALGYPVGKVDGSFGSNTLYALNLFQFAAGLKQCSYANATCQERLYAASAPYYDPYLPLVKGDSGTPVRLMQEALIMWGFHPGSTDGKFGANTVKALAAFQAYVGLPVNGSYASAECLLVLFTQDPTSPSDLNG